MNFKKALCIIGSIAFLNLSTIDVFANEQEGYDPCYKSLIDYDHPEFGTNDMWLYQISSNFGSEIVLRENDLRRTFFMYNDRFIFEENIIIEKDYALIEAQKLSEYLNISIEIKENTVRLYKKIGGYEYSYLESTFTANSDKVLTTDHGIETTPVQTKIVDGKFYIPLRYAAGGFGFVVSYAEDGIGPFNNPVVAISNKAAHLLEKEAVDLAVKEVSNAYEMYLKNNNISHTASQRATVMGQINNAKCIGKLSNYYVIESVHTLLVDGSTGEIFVKYGTGKSGHGSYIEMIQTLVVDELFAFL